jgi:hypothetical protein
MAKAKPPQILTGDDYDTIERTRARIAQVHAAIAQAEQCGVDCQQSKSDLQWADESLTKFKAVLFPHGRPK